MNHFPERVTYASASRQQTDGCCVKKKVMFANRPSDRQREETPAITHHNSKEVNV